MKIPRKRHLFDILESILQGNLMERLNLNVPSEARAALRRLAKRAQRKEAELARELLVRAIGDAEREEFACAMAEMSPAARSRLRAVAGALEKVRAGAR